MFPAGQGGDPVQPAVDMRPVGTGESERLGVIQMAATGKIGDGRAAGCDPVAVRQMRVQQASLIQEWGGGLEDLEQLLALTEDLMGRL